MRARSLDDREVQPLRIRFARKCGTFMECFCYFHSNWDPDFVQNMLPNTHNRDNYFVFVLKNIPSWLFSVSGNISLQLVFGCAIIFIKITQKHTQTTVQKAVRRFRVQAILHTPANIMMQSQTVRTVHFFSSKHKNKTKIHTIANVVDVVKNKNWR